MRANNTPRDFASKRTWRIGVIAGISLPSGYFRHAGDGPKCAQEDPVKVTKCKIMNTITHTDAKKLPKVRHLG
jgi:hypothetical protein